MTRPSFIIASADVTEKEGHYPQSDETLGFSRPVGRAAGLQRIGLHIERVPPGQRISYPHCHSEEEEFVFVLEGEVDAWIDGALHRMRKGDLAAFPAGTGVCHTFINNGTAEALLLGGGEHRKPADRVYYPHNPERRAQVPPERWWDDAPVGPQGDHDGRPKGLT